jgi:hypothetical protein
MEHFSLLATLCHSCVYSSKCCGMCGVFERGGYPSIYTGQEAMLEAIFGAKHALHCLCMLRRHRPMKGWLSSAGRGRPPLGSSQSLTEPPHHRLRVGGHGLDKGCSPRVLCPFLVDLVDVSLILLCKSALESAFR